MASHREDILKRPLYVYNIPNHVLETLTFNDDVNVTESYAQEPQAAPSDRSARDALASSQSCSLCGVDFSSLLDQRSHLKTDLHQYNLRQKIRGLKPVSELEFVELIGDLDESLSGSDSDESDDNGLETRPESNLTALLKKKARLANHEEGNISTEKPGNGTVEGRTRAKAPLVWFSSPVLLDKTYFGLYRALITAEEQCQPDLVRVLRDKQLAPIAAPNFAKGATLPPPVYTGPHIFLCMIGGGHFAGMVVSLAPRALQGPTTMNREATVLAHKTFHRYTTRRKQGGSQSANDNSKGNAHSAGSSLRRYNEQALVNDVRNLLRDWKALLDTSELLFVRATGLTNHRTLFGPCDEQVLQHNDIRLRGFPFSTRRATQKELMRAFIELTRLKVREIDPAKEVKEPQPASVPKKPSSPKPAKPKFSEEEETALLHTSQLQAFIRRSKLPALLSYIENNALSADFEFQPPDQHHRTPRPLHMAAAQNSSFMVLGILTRGGADPGLKTVEGRTAFELAGDRSTRDAFRVARSELGESKWTWEVAGVPAAMTRVEAERRDEREKCEAGKKESERRNAEEERLRVEEAREPEMSKRLERERRARAAEERMRKIATQ